MKSVKKFFTDLRGALKKDDGYISDLSGGQATAEFLRLSFAPFCISLSLGLFVLITNHKWDQVLLNAITEFLQFTGVKLSLYYVILIIGFGFVLYKVRLLTHICAWLVKIISHSAFPMCAVMTGVLWGLIIPVIIEGQNLYNLGIILNATLLTIPLAVLFYYSASIFKIETRQEIDRSFGVHTSKVTVSIGIALIGLVVVFLFFEENWKEVSKINTCQETIESTSIIDSTQNARP